MKTLARTILGSTTVAGLAALAPVSIDPVAVTQGDSPVRMSIACGQSQTCIKATNYVCYAGGYYYNNMRSGGSGS